jgi:hypothetical protein
LPLLPSNLVYLNVRDRETIMFVFWILNILKIEIAFSQVGKNKLSGTVKIPSSLTFLDVSNNQLIGRIEYEGNELIDCRLYGNGFAESNCFVDSDICSYCTGEYGCSYRETINRGCLASTIPSTTTMMMTTSQNSLSSSSSSESTTTTTTMSKSIDSTIFSTESISFKVITTNFNVESVRIYFCFNNIFILHSQPVFFFTSSQNQLQTNLFLYG